MNLRKLVVAWAFSMVFALVCHGALAGSPRQTIYQVGKLKPIDSVLKLRPGQLAPDFELPALDGSKVRLSSFRGKKNVVLSFVPAAFTPVCSEQWPGYKLAEDEFKKRNTVLLGITVDNLPTLYAWTKNMGGVWFPVLSDFWPHGRVASTYGILRSDGTSERALIAIDKQGVVRYIDVHNINLLPDLGELIQALDRMP